MKKWLMMLTLLLYLAPAAQGATPKFAWYIHGQQVPNGIRQPTIAWGTLTVQSGSVTSTCKVAEAAWIVNNSEPEEHAQGETVVFHPYECVSPNCPAPQVIAEPSVGKEGFQLWPDERWRQQAEEGANEEYSERYVGMRLVLKCSGQSSEITGIQTAKWQNGTSAGKPSERVFNDPAIKGRMKVEIYESTPVPTVTLGPAA